ncbi:HIRAN domain-containing protein [Rubritalea tangerina]|uniref:HIRAN domain-containing protein n=1 Tax=Rubritalea tangerina TaxID=430798 RepID=UPI00361B6520
MGLRGNSPKEIRLLKAGTSVQLYRQPKNPHDRNAISVHLEGSMIGFIPKDLAEKLAPLLDVGNQASAKISRVTSKKPKPPNLERFPESL